MTMRLRRLFAVLLLLAGIAGPAWAVDQTIDLLTPGAAVTGTEKIPVYQGSNPAVSITPRALQTYNSTLTASVDVGGQAGAPDICTQMSNAITALLAINAAGGIIDARSMSTNNNGSPYACATPPWNSRAGTIGTAVTTILLPFGGIAVDQTWIVPMRQRLECPAGNVQPQLLFGCWIQPSNNFPSFSVTGPTLTVGTPTIVTFTTASHAFEGMLVAFRDNGGDTLPTGLKKEEKYHLHFTTGPGGGSNNPGTCSSSCTAELWMSFDPLLSPGTQQRMTTSGAVGGAHLLVSEVPIVQGGSDVWTSSPGSIDQFGHSLHNVTMLCSTPGGTYPTGAIGYYGVQGEENTKLEGLATWNCVDNFGIWYGGGVGSGNILQDWNSTINNVPITANAGCLSAGLVGNTANYNNGQRYIQSTLHNLTCRIVPNNASNVTVPYAILMNGPSFGIENGYGEMGTFGAGTLTLTNVISVGGAVGGLSAACGGMYVRNLQIGYAQGAVTVTSSFNDVCNLGQAHYENVSLLATIGNTLFTDNHGCTVTYNNNTGTMVSPQDNQIALYRRRGDGSGTSNRRSQFRFTSTACPDIAP